MDSAQFTGGHGVPTLGKNDMDEMVRVLLEDEDWSGLDNYSVTPIVYIASHIFRLEIQEQPLDSHMDALGFVVYEDVPYLTGDKTIYLTQFKKETLVVNSYLLKTHSDIQRNAVIARLLAHWLLHYDYLTDQAHLMNAAAVHVVKKWTDYPTPQKRKLELQASEFASALLMPAITVPEIAGNAFAKYHVKKGIVYNSYNRKLYKALKTIANYYGVSMQTARVRMRDLHYIA